MTGAARTMIATAALAACLGAAAPAPGQPAGGPGGGSADGFGAPELLFLPEEREALAFGGRPPPAPDPDADGGAGTGPAPPDAAEAEPLPPPRLSLDGLLYLGPKRWAVWLDGERLDSTGAGLRPDVRIHAVSGDAVRLSWFPDGATGPYRLLLRPNQVFDTGSGQVTEAGP
ncbi:MAG: hypothetical protein RID91_23130 [Azospirillaceae bacterium]